MQYPGSMNVVPGVTFPESSAAAAVTSLKVEPGAYRPAVAGSEVARPGRTPPAVA